MNGNMLLLLINHDTDMLLVWLPKERYDPIVWLIIKLNSDIIIRWYNKRKGKGSRRRFRIQSRLRLMDGTLFNASTTWFTCYDIQRQKGKIIIYCFYSYYMVLPRSMSLVDRKRNEQVSKFTRLTWINGHSYRQHLEYSIWLHVVLLIQKYLWSEAGLLIQVICHSDEQLLLTEHILESLDVVATYDYEEDEWGCEGQLTLARGSADATVTQIPKSYWNNKFDLVKPKILFPWTWLQQCKI